MHGQFPDHEQCVPIPSIIPQNQSCKTTGIHTPPRTKYPISCVGRVDQALSSPTILVTILFILSLFLLYVRRGALFLFYSILIVRYLS